MPTAQLVALDLLAAAAAAVTLLGAGSAAAAGRARAALALLAATVLASAARVGVVAALAGSGWWFVQEKITLTLPLLGAAGLVAAWLAGPRLVRAARRDGPAGAAAPAVVVPLLTAGYAAAVGLVVTFLIGYPVGWAEAVISVALVAAGGLVTWRAVAPAPSTARLRAGGATLAIGLAGVGLAFVPAEAVDAGAGAPVRYPAPAGRLVTALRGDTTPAPGGTVLRHTLTARAATVTLSSGRRIDAWTFNGQVPGPPITATEGDLIEVTLRNADIQRGVTLHWHGFDVPSGDDGAPGLTQAAVAPGQEFVYRFRAGQIGTYWYHTHQVSDIGVRMGLYGTLVVSPRGAPAAGLDLTLPVHRFGGVTAVAEHDRTVQRRVPVGTPVRLRLINTDSTPHRFTLAGTPYRLIAIDGRDLNRPGQLSADTLVLAAGGRYDLAFVMPAGAAALLVDGDRGGGLRLLPGGMTEAGPVDTSRWPELDLTRYGAPAPTPFDAGSRFDRRFTLVLDRTLAVAGGVPRYAQTVNGRAFPSTPTQIVRENDLVLMTIVNRGQDIHPWHLHGHAVRVLSRDGRAPTGSPLLVDSLDVRPGEVWRVGFRATNPGLWMNHCHDLRHFDQGMALHLAYEGVAAAFHGPHDG